MVRGAAARQRPVGGQAEPGHTQQGARAPADPSARRGEHRVWGGLGVGAPAMRPRPPTHMSISFRPPRSGPRCIRLASTHVPASSVRALCGSGRVTPTHPHVGEMPCTVHNAHRHRPPLWRRSRHRAAKKAAAAAAGGGLQGAHAAVLLGEHTRATVSSSSGESLAPNPTCPTAPPLPSGVCVWVHVRKSWKRLCASRTI